VLAWEMTYHLDPAPGLSEGRLQQVRVTDSLAVLDPVVETGQQRAQVGEQTVDCSWATA
jgi:hypothetical protein